jgi:signal transduction histidine kinase/ligand-binding sensor domain-containing protein
LAWLALGLIFFQPSRLRALDPSRHLSQLGHTAWRLQDGLFNGLPTAITQTADGYLWIGTRNGLVRFDGVRFTPWTAPNGSSFPSLDIVSLLGAGDGSLWVGTTGGLGRISGTQISTIDPSARINQIVQDSHGTIWFGRSRISGNLGSLCEVVKGTTHCFGKSDGLAVGPISALSVDDDNSIWSAGSNTLARWKSGVATNYDLSALDHIRDSEGVMALLSDHNRSVLVGFQRTGAGLGLQSFSDGKWQSYLRNAIKSSNLSVECLLRDRDGGLWVGTTSNGMYRLNNDTVDHFTTADGLSADAVTGLFEDKEGDVWVSTTGGIDRFRNARVATFSVKQGLMADSVSSIAAGRENKVWIGNFGALQFWHDGKISSITPREGLPGQRVTSLLEDHAGALWVGVDDQLYVYEHNHFHRIERPESRGFGVVVGMMEDSAHDIWTVVDPNHFPQDLVRIRNRKIVQDKFPFGGGVMWPLVATPQNNLFVELDSGRIADVEHSQESAFRDWHLAHPKTSFISVVADRGGHLWAATKIGLLGWDGKRTEWITKENGLSCDRLNTLVFDKHQDLWLSSECGYIKLPQSQLDGSWSSAHPTFKPQLLDATDGAQPALATFSPQSTMSTDGKLWFATETIVQMIDPEQLGINRDPPPVYIENVVADHRVYPGNESLQLAANTREIEINFAGLSLVAPEKVRFKYRLDGWDTEWQDSSSRRQAFYTNLQPRTYTFHVIAANNDGIWNERGATISMIIQPAFYQTSWFIALVSLFVLCLLYLAYLARLQHVTDQIKAGVSERAAERERIALELHDTFFQGIQGLLLRFNAGTSLLRPDEPARTIFVETLEQSDRVMLEGRELVLDLRRDDSDTLGFAESLAKYGEEFRGRSKAEFTIVVSGTVRPLQPASVIEMHRIAKEAIYNAFVHAGQAKIEVEVGYEQRAFMLRIRDNGVGIDDQVLKDGSRVGHLGLPGMQNRAKKINGVLTVRSGRGLGTEIELSVPAYIAFLNTDLKNKRFAAWMWRKLRIDLNGGRHD